MTLDGNIIEPAKPTLGTILARLAMFGIGLLVLAVAFWTAIFMIPIFLVLGMIGYFAFRSRLRRGGPVVFTRRF